MNRQWKILWIVVAVTAVLAIGAAAVYAMNERGGGHTIAVEIAENGTKFTFDTEPVFDDDGLPAYGNEFITEGYIYPAGTLTCDENGCNGVLDDGAPEFPDQVLGRWVCRGWHVGEGAHSQGEPWVASTQIFSFGPVPGQKTIISDGFELPDVGGQISRAITGGTGMYRQARGEQVQAFLGWNPSMGVALQVQLRVR
jgi:hypothetical protein